jgi:glycine/sarcosine N-methyltransferase
VDESVSAFYDELADVYHLIYADWRASMTRQSGILDRLIREQLGDGPWSILDAACGIGTQAIGLALLGHRVHASDISYESVERAKREAAAVGAAIMFEVADFRELSPPESGPVDVVIACDNALPHLMRDEELDLAVAKMSATLRNGGMFLASIRDYDRLVRDRPQREGPRIVEDSAGKRITFQIWDWDDDGRSYELHQVVMRQLEDGWRTDHFVAHYRALLRADLERSLRRTGLTDIRWHEPDATGFHQPIVTGCTGLS